MGYHHHRNSDRLSTRTVDPNHRIRVFEQGPHETKLKNVAMAEFRLKRAESEKRAREIADAATSYMKLNEDEPLWKG